MRSLNDHDEIRAIIFAELTKNLPEFNVPEYHPLRSPKTKSSRVYGKMFETVKYADVALKTKDGLRIMAHKFVLAGQFFDKYFKLFLLKSKISLKNSANSKVFDAMLEGPETEAQYKELKIDDVDFVTLKALLKFIYCEKVDTKDLTLDLLVAAKKFEVEDLIMECSSYMRANLSVGNAIESFIQIEDDELKNDAVIFIGRYKPEVLSLKISSNFINFLVVSEITIISLEHRIGMPLLMNSQDYLLNCSLDGAHISIDLFFLLILD